MKKFLLFFLTFIMIVNCYCVAFAAVSYFPDVSKEMSDPMYWSKDDKVLLSYDEILNINKSIVDAKGTNVIDLLNMPATVDGVALNEALIKSTTADAEYYLGWTYLGTTTLATKADFEGIIANTQNGDAKKQQDVLYGIAVKSTVLRTFPSDIPIWDDPGDKDLDYQCLTNVRVNEPFVITTKSKDGKYYLAKGISCSGWIEVQSVAICQNKQQWKDAWDIPANKTLVVYGDKVHTETAITGSETSNLLLTMGTVLEVAQLESPNVLTDNRAAYQTHVVYIPVRNQDGSYAKKLTLIPENEKVNDGYLPLTKANIAKVAFSSLGNVYGWGNGLNSDDCSGYVRNIYKCFGLELARNTTWQTAMPVAGTSMQGMCREDRVALIKNLPIGSVLHFNGHEMLYLGCKNDKFYVINALGSVLEPYGGGKVQRIRSIVINTLDVKRGSGNAWIDELNYVNVPYLANTDENKSIFPPKTWYHNGVAYCISNKYMKGDDNGFFRPDDLITTAEFIQILYNMAGKPSVNTEKQFKNWYDEALTWYEQTFKIDKENMDKFVADEQVTRGLAAGVFYEYAKKTGIAYESSEQADITAYKDAGLVAPSAIPAFKYMVSHGIISGKTSDTLAPMDNITRAEMAAIIKRFNDKHSK